MTPGVSPETEKMGHHRGGGLQEEAGMTRLFEAPRDTARTGAWSRGGDGGPPGERAQ